MNAIDDVPASPETDLAQSLRSVVALAGITYSAAGVSAGSDLDFTAVNQVRAAVTQPPALVHIAAALEDMPRGDLHAALSECASRLPWVAGDLPKSPGIVDKYAFIEILGPSGIDKTDRLRFGLYLQAPDVFYPAHDHEAEEFYYVLSGDAEWQKNDGVFAEQPPGTLVHHAPRDRHAMRTRAKPLLAMWIWTGDLDMKTYRIDGAA